MAEPASKSQMNSQAKTLGATALGGVASAGYLANSGNTPDNVAQSNTAGAAISNEGVPLYNQKDNQWKDRTLERVYTIGQYGCAVTSTAMSLSKISGEKINPEQMDQYLDDNHGYHNEMIIWEIAAKKIGTTAAMMRSIGNKATIDRSLESGHPCVISVNQRRHWVCVAGRNADGTYIIHDPEGGKQIGAKWDEKSRNILVDGYREGTELRTFGI